MSAIVNYLGNMIPYMVIVIPLFGIVRTIHFKRTNTEKINWYREIILFLYILFIVGLASQAIVPELEIAQDGRLGIRNSGSGVRNFIPFKFLPDTYRETIKNGNMNYFIINILGNIIMFMPIGFCVPLLWKTSNRTTILVGFCSSLFIEVSQLFIARCTDVDDLILNTFGSALGLFLFRLLYRFRKKGTDKYNYDFATG